MNLRRIVNKLKLNVLSALLIISFVFVLSGCTLETKTPEVEPEEVENSVATQEETPEVVAPEEKPVITPPANEPKTNTSPPKEGTTNQIPVTLVSTTDGDTIRVMYNGKDEPVRYLLIDTPETNHPRLGKQPFGDEAKERNRELVNSGNLTIEFDIGEKRDKYDRLLAYVYVNGQSVQETLVSEGLARVAYVYPPNTRYLTPYEEAQEAAKSKKIGIWSVEDYSTDSGFQSQSQPVVATPPASQPSTSTESEFFQNCTELRKKYPSGVPSNHPAYQSKMDRDKDNYACER
ncbi:MAG: thermonuclease family protein [Paenisporosarcina sp.]